MKSDKSLKDMETTAKDMLAFYKRSISGARAQQRYHDGIAVANGELDVIIDNFGSKHSTTASRQKAPNQISPKVLDVLKAMNQVLLDQRGCSVKINSSKFHHSYDMQLSCGAHEDCNRHKLAYWKILNISFPACRSWRFLSQGVEYFVVFACATERNAIGRGNTECAAFEEAVERLNAHLSGARRCREITAALASYPVATP